MEWNEKYGKHMVANQDIKPGEIIAVEEAYVAFPLKNKQFLICSHCLKQTWNGIPCNFCTSNIYCSEKCNQQAWVEYHDVECSIMPIVTNPKDEKVLPFLDPVLFHKATLRFFIKFIKSFGLENIIQEIKTAGKHLRCVQSFTYIMCIITTNTFFFRF